MQQRETGAVASRPWDRRSDPDRRRPHLTSDWRYAWNGRRQVIRRAEDARSAGLDVYHPRLLLLVVAILVLNGLDAVFTLRLVHAGAAEEWNPLMRALLHDDVQLFVNLKVAITSGALLLLVACSQTVILNGFKVERLLHWMLAGYLVLVGYHLVLLQVSGLH
jgi:hypothetical protein